MITYNYRVNMTPGGIPPRCKLGQYDDDWSIVFSLFTDSGTLTIESGTTAKIRGTKRDGLGYSANATINISAGTVTVAGDKQITAIAGDNVFELVLLKGTKELSTANIIFAVEPAAMDAGTLVSDSQVQEILNMSADVIAASENVSTLRGNFAPTYSSSPGTTYQVGDYVMHDNQLYRCTTAITTAEAWTPAHWTAVSLGPAVSDLKSDIYALNCGNLLDNLIHRNLDNRGIVWRWKGNTCHVSGTATATANNDMYISSEELPTGFRAGETYHVYYSSSNVNMRIYAYPNEGLLTELISTKTDADVTIPSNTIGLIIRLNVPSGTVVNETITPAISATLSNDALELLIKARLGELTALSPINYSVPDETTVPTMDADDIDINSVYFVTSSSGVPRISNVPFAPCWLLSEGNGSTLSSLAFQVAIPYYSDSNEINFRIKRGGVWGNWRAISKDNRTIYVNGDSYSNTYDIETSPTITTDTNGWLQPVDTDSTAESAATDMTGAILSMLNSTGYCHLAPGIFYVSGNIDLPFGSTLEGCGSKTVIRLLSSVQSGYIVKATRYSTVRGIKFSGGAENPDFSTADIGGRHGIVFIDDASEGGDLPYVRPCVINDCWFENFSGAGIYCNDSGGGTHQSLIVSSCYIEYCKVGIDIWFYSEYHKFSNIITFHCYYACINNGGNNVFVGCTFHGTIGFLIDNASGDVRNPGHGSAIGCTFNHIDNWNHPTEKGGGVGVHIQGNTIGFVFTGCQFWYGVIEIIDSAGVLISDSQIGGNASITVSGQYPAFFNSCVFHTRPTMNVNSISKFNDCYLHDTGESVSN